MPKQRSRSLRRRSVYPSWTLVKIWSGVKARCTFLQDQLPDRLQDKSQDRSQDRSQGKLPDSSQDRSQAPLKGRLQDKFKDTVRSKLRWRPKVGSPPPLRLSRLRIVPTLNLLPLLPSSLLRRTLLFKADVSMADDTPSKDYTLGKFLVHCTIILWLIFILLNLREQRMPWGSSLGKGAETPLVMQGGDPYIRALMRTISASESNVQNPYAVIYGGEYTQDLSRHPDLCVPIAVGPNVGQCTTAAGRYQFITTTWVEQAERYHPNPGGFWLWHRYSFEPLYQDTVVYRWLSDAQVWGVDLSSLLRQGKITRVLEILSPTWTSLGYGIETNSMSASLPQVYQRVLREELSLASMPTIPQIQPNGSIGAPANLPVNTPNHAPRGIANTTQPQSYRSANLP